MKGYDREIKDGCFYEEEMQKSVGIKLSKLRRFFLEIMKMVRKRMVLVKWLGWPSPVGFAKKWLTFRNLLKTLLK